MSRFEPRRFEQRRPEPCRSEQRRPERRRSTDRGSSTVLAVGVIGATVLFAGATVPAVGVFAAQQSAQNAADAAALATADTLSGRVAGYPCENASQAAELDGAHLTHCDTSGLIAVVSVSRAYLSLEVVARARAGPQGSG